jgi:hypothetical protein
VPTKIMTRAIQRAIARTLIALFLFAQMMVAAYACPLMSTDTDAIRTHALATSVAQVMLPDAAADMSGCDGVTFDSPNLCAAHCQAGDQNTDAAQAVAVPANVLSGFYVVQITSPSSGLDRHSTSREFVYAIPPPHAILHCCFRI